MNAAGKIALILTLVGLLTAATGPVIAHAFAPQNVLADISRQFAQTENEWKRPLTNRLESLEIQLAELQKKYPSDPRIIVWHTTVLIKLQRWSKAEEELLRFVSGVRSISVYERAQIYHRLIYASWQLGGISRVFNVLRLVGPPPFYLWIYLFGNAIGTVLFALATGLTVARKDRRLFTIAIMWAGATVLSQLWVWGWAFLTKASSPNSSFTIFMA